MLDESRKDRRNVLRTRKDDKVRIWPLDQDAEQWLI